MPFLFRFGVPFTLVNKRHHISKKDAHHCWKDRNLNQLLGRYLKKQRNFNGVSFMHHVHIRKTPFLFRTVVLLVISVNTKQYLILHSNTRTLTQNVFSQGMFRFLSHLPGRLRAIFVAATQYIPLPLPDCSILQSSAAAVAIGGF